MTRVIDYHVKWKMEKLDKLVKKLVYRKKLHRIIEEIPKNPNKKRGSTNLLPWPHNYYK